MTTNLLLLARSDRKSYWDHYIELFENTGIDVTETPVDDLDIYSMICHLNLKKIDVMIVDEVEQWQTYGINTHYNFIPTIQVVDPTKPNNHINGAVLVHYPIEWSELHQYVTKLVAFSHSLPRFNKPN
jgi:hypothetical protein